MSRRRRSRRTYSGSEKNKDVRRNVAVEVGPPAHTLKKGGNPSLTFSFFFRVYLTPTSDCTFKSDSRLQHHREKGKRATSLILRVLSTNVKSEHICVASADVRANSCRRTVTK